MSIIIIMELLCIVVLSLFCISQVTADSDDPPGHLKPLGGHMPPIGSIEETGSFPLPRVFYEEFVKPEKPLLIKSALNMEGVEFPAYAKWSDDYLREKYGSEVVEVERGKKEKRDAGMLHIPLAKFLDVYQLSNVYLVHNVPNAMQDDVWVPVSVRCGGFQNSLLDAIIWFSSGGTKSILHYDNTDNINCVLDGTKEFVIIEKVHKPMVEADGFNRRGAFSQVDVERVDMRKFPKLQDVPWYKVHMEKGDCLFLPNRWYHQVNSGEGRNLALNFWFPPLLWFNNTDCEGVDTSAQTYPLHQFTFATPNEQIRSDFLLKYKGIPALMKGDFLLGAEKTELFMDRERAKELYNIIDSDRNGFLTWDELYSFDIDEAVKKYPDILGLLNDEELEEFMSKNKKKKKDEEEDVIEIIAEEDEDEQEAIEQSHEEL